jgi:hypothetical protein
MLPLEVCVPLCSNLCAVVLAFVGVGVVFEQRHLLLREDQTLAEVVRLLPEVPWTFLEGVVLDPPKLAIHTFPVQDIVHLFDSRFGQRRQ